MVKASEIQPTLNEAQKQYLHQVRVIWATTGFLVGMLGGIALATFVLMKKG